MKLFDISRDIMIYCVSVLILVICYYCPFSSPCVSLSRIWSILLILSHIQLVFHLFFCIVFFSIYTIDFYPYLYYFFFLLALGLFCSFLVSCGVSLYYYFVIFAIIKMYILATINFCTALAEPDTF